MPKKYYLDFLSKCALVTDPYECYLVRQKLDKDFNSTNTSAYNIYSKCYNSTKAQFYSEQLGIINQGC